MNKEELKPYIQLADLYFSGLTDNEIVSITEEYGSTAEEVHVCRKEHDVLWRPNSIWLFRHRAKVLRNFVKNKFARKQMPLEDSCGTDKKMFVWQEELMLDVMYIKRAASRLKDLLKLNETYDDDYTEMFITSDVLRNIADEPDETLFEQQEEWDLFNAVRKVRFNGDWYSYCNSLESLNPVVKAYMDNVLIHDKREHMAKNKFRLLLNLERLYMEMCDFSKLKM